MRKQRKRGLRDNSGNQAYEWGRNVLSLKTNKPMKKQNKTETVIAKRAVGLFRAVTLLTGEWLQRC